MRKKNKKKILFDVFADSDQGSGSRFEGDYIRRSPRSRKPLSDGEFRLTYNFAIVLATVFVGFIAFSYYIGTLHGRRGPEPSDLKLRVDAGAAMPEEESSGYAVRALTEEYTVYTRGDLLTHFESCVHHLLDQDFASVVVYDNPSEVVDGGGEFVLWVGRSSDRDELGRIAERIRDMVFKKKYIFAAAHVAWLDGR